MGAKSEIFRKFTTYQRYNEVMSTGQGNKRESNEATEDFDAMTIEEDDESERLNG